MLIVFACICLAFKMSIYEKFNINNDLKILITFEVLTVFFFYMLDLYNDKALRREGIAISVAISTIATCVCAWLINIVLNWYYQSIRMWFIMLGLMFFSMEIWRFLQSALFLRYKNKEKILIVETVNSTSNLARKIKYSHTNVNSAWYYIIDDHSEDEVEKLINSVVPQYDIIFLSPKLETEVIDKISIQTMMLKKKLSVLADVKNVSVMNASIRQYTDTPVIENNGFSLSKIELFIKRIFDIVASLIGLILLSPFFLISAIMVKLDSPGPVIYKQERYTIGKKRFNIYKFRTMVNDAEKKGAVFASDNDPRITKSGKILRALRLDELPQIINILRGDMSIVGPRPERPVFADEFEKELENYKLRYLVKAGLTGYAQVYGKYNTEAKDKILMDFIYESNYSLLLDLKIIILTIKTMFTKSATEGVSDTDDKLEQHDREVKRRETSLSEIGDDVKSSSKVINKKSRVSVIIPAYNSAKYIKKCIDSLMIQNYNNLEVIVVNDGSKDNTLDILKTYGDKIKIISVENGGAARARNIGLENATGDFILFLDGDDYYEKNCISDLVEFQENTKVDIVIFGYKIILPDGKIKFPDTSIKGSGIIEKKDFKKEIYPYFITGITLNSVWRAMYKRSCLEGVRFRENMKTAEDAVFNLEAYTNAQSAASLNVMYYCYVQNSGSITGSGLKIKEKYKNNFRLSKEILRHLKPWGMNNPYWIIRTFLRPVVLTFDKLLRMFNL